MLEVILKIKLDNNGRACKISCEPMPASPSQTPSEEYNNLQNPQQRNISAEELAAYTHSVRLRIKNQDGVIFRNYSHKHAEIIIREFLNAANSTVRIFCGKLSTAVYGTLLPYFQQALARNVTIHVMTAETLENLESKELAQMLKENKCIRQIPKTHLQGAHFMLADNRMFRLEAPRGERAALVCANALLENKQVMESLTRGYDTLWQHASVL